MTMSSMKTFFRSIIGLLCLQGMLSSCYFNSTARIYDKASYEARANAADLNASPNPVVYQNGSSYYIELPRYRYGTPLKMQHSVFDDEWSEPATLEPRGTGMFCISPEFAQYLTGESRKKCEISQLQEVPNAAEIKQLSRRIPVVRKADEREVSYVYRSPNAGWLHAAAPFNWVFVDLPVTLVENAAIVASVVGLVWLIVEDYDDCYDEHHHHHHHRHHRH